MLVLILIANIMSIYQVYGGAQYCYFSQTKTLHINLRIYYYGDHTAKIWFPFIKKDIYSVWLNKKRHQVYWHNQTYFIKFNILQKFISRHQFQKLIAKNSNSSNNFIELTDENSEGSSYVASDENENIFNYGSWLYPEMQGYWDHELQKFFYMQKDAIPAKITGTQKFTSTKVAAHEFGHLLGLKHPNRGNLFGLGNPDIMAPRGIYVDAPYQLEPSIDPMLTPLEPGARMNLTVRTLQEKNLQELLDLATSVMTDSIEGKDRNCVVLGALPAKS